MSKDLVDQAQGVLTSPAREEVKVSSLMFELASNPDFDADKMRAATEMQREEEDRNAKKAFNRAFVAARSEMPDIIAKAHNKQTNSKYANLDDIQRVINPIMNKHGLEPTFGTFESTLPDHYGVTCDLIHGEGWERNYRADVPMDTKGIKGTANKTPMHGFGASMSYGRRYILTLIWNLTIAGEDTDGNAIYDEEIGDEQINDLTRLVEAAQSDVRQICAHYKVDALKNLSNKQYGAAVSLLNAKIKRNAK